MVGSLTILDRVRSRAKQAKQTIALAEPQDDRVLHAADYLLKENIVPELVLIGNNDKVRARAKELSLNIDRAIVE